MGFYLPSQCVIYLIPYENDSLRGRVYSEYYKKSFQFANELEMLSGMNDMFDSMEFPQSSYQLRTFYDKKIKRTVRRAEDTLDHSMDEILQNEKTTFVVNIQYRQNATWQGTITWVEGERTQRFRSSFEMLKLMEEATRRGEIDAISWDGDTDR
ncbi:MAG TPA: hypothetical protein VHO71_05345 [Caproiciproducens sp.]|nr:hypothetical protein [Caproiciproducens sp.]